MLLIQHLSSHFLLKKIFSSLSLRMCCQRHLANQRYVCFDDAKPVSRYLSIYYSSASVPDAATGCHSNSDVIVLLCRHCCQLSEAILGITGRPNWSTTSTLPILQIINYQILCFKHLLFAGN